MSDLQFLLVSSLAIGLGLAASLYLITLAGRLRNRYDWSVNAPISVAEWRILMKKHGIGTP